jgi:hypothetical protein
MRTLGSRVLGSLLLAVSAVAEDGAPAASRRAQATQARLDRRQVARVARLEQKHAARRAHRGPGVSGSDAARGEVAREPAVAKAPRGVEHPGRAALGAGTRGAPRDTVQGFTLGCL